jgi:transposase-like protein
VRQQLASEFFSLSMSKRRPHCPHCDGAGAAVGVKGCIGKIVVSYVCGLCGHGWEIESPAPILPRPACPQGMRE